VQEWDRHKKKIKKLLCIKLYAIDQQNKREKNLEKNHTISSFNYARIEDGIFFTNLPTMEWCSEKKNDGYFMKEDEQLTSLIYVEVGQHNDRIGIP